MKEKKKGDHEDGATHDDEKGHKNEGHGHGDEHGHGHKPEEKHKSPGGNPVNVYEWITTIAIWFLIIVGVIIGILLYPVENTGHKKKTIPKTTLSENSSHGSNQTTPKRERTWKTFNFEGGAGIVVYLEPGWDDIPLGGKIKIKTPTGKFLHDEPGPDKYFGMQPKGYYTFYPNSENAEGVQIYNFFNEGKGF